MTAASRLWFATLVVCGLFVAEDPTVIAVRTQFNDTRPAAITLDIALAVVMVGYNFAASRYVVSVAADTTILDAMAVVDSRRAARVVRTKNVAIRNARRVVAHLNPFDVIKLIGDRLGRSLERISASARHRRLRRTAAFLEDLGAVNVLGVPGVGLAIASRGRHVSPTSSLRHSVLFVGSWFAGARAIGWTVGRLHQLPLIGAAAKSTTGAIGAVFAFFVDVSTPVGAITVAAVAASIARYTHQVDRILHAPTLSPLTGAATE